MHWSSWTTFIVSLLAFAIAEPNPLPVSGDAAAASPSVCKDNTGKYFLFNGAVGLNILTSTDRVQWTLIGKVFPNGAPWSDQYTGTSNGRLWAPDCTYVNGVFWVYYSASSLGSQNSGTFLAKSSTGQPGSFSNEGLVISTTSANNYNAIDANLFIEGSNWYLTIGSYWTGIKLLNINPSTGKPSSGTLTALAQRASGSGIEASNLVKRNGYYYLFTSWDRDAGGVNSTYNIRVGRSSSVTGPYVGQGGTALLDGGGSKVLGSHDNVHGPGGQDLLFDTDSPILFYHYKTAAANGQLGINHLDFSSGWPVVV